MGLGLGRVRLGSEFGPGFGFRVRIIVLVGKIRARLRVRDRVRLCERYEWREERDHRIIDLAPQKGDVVGQRRGAVVAGEDKGSALRRAPWRGVGVCKAREQRRLLVRDRVRVRVRVRG